MWFSKKVDEVKEVIEASPPKKVLLEKIETLEKELEIYKEWWEQMQETTRDSEVVIDFAAIDAFSVERMVNNNLPQTVVGYLKEETVVDSNGVAHVNRGVKEWYYFCSEKRHQELVDKFKEYKKII